MHVIRRHTARGQCVSEGFGCICVYLSVLFTIVVVVDFSSVGDVGFQLTVVGGFYLMSVFIKWLHLLYLTIKSVCAVMRNQCFSFGTSQSGLIISENKATLAHLGHYNVTGTGSSLLWSQVEVQNDVTLVSLHQVSSWLFFYDR